MGPKAIISVFRGGRKLGISWKIGRKSLVFAPMMEDYILVFQLGWNLGLVLKIRTRLQIRDHVRIQARTKNKSENQTD